MLWIFDLDNTLHDASHAIFPAITANMNAFIAGLAGENSERLSPESANAVRILYWERYGATLEGLIRHHGVEPEEFLKAAHDLGDLSLLIKAERGLARILRQLPGRKILLTNADHSYSRRVLKLLGLHRYFSQHIAIQSMRVHGKLLPKPSKRLFRKLLASEKVSAHQCVLVEDNEAALKAGKALGMRTVFVSGFSRRDRTSYHSSPRKKRLEQKNRPAFADVKIRSIRHLPAKQSKLGQLSSG